MHPVARICGLLLFSFTIFARDVSPAPEYARAVTQISEMIEWEMREKAIPAVSIALVDDQKVVWSAGFGLARTNVPASADTIYRVGSVSKLFTDIAIMVEWC